MRQITNAYRAATDLVFIGRANAPACCTDLARTSGGFAQPIQIAVDWQDQRAIVCNRKVFGVDSNALPFKLFNLALQMPRIEDHAIANNR